MACPGVALYGRRRGFLLAEVLLGIAVFAVFAGAVAAVMISGQENTILGGDRTRGAYLAERTLEGARAIRDAAFSSLSAGTHGVAVNGATNKWSYSGSQVTMTGGYVTNVSVLSSGTGLHLTARTTWKHGYNRSGSVVLTTELTDWRTPGTLGDWSDITLQGSAAPGGTPEFTDIAVSGDYVFITGSISGGGNGLYMYDVSDLSNPVRVNSGLDLGYDGYQMAIRGKTLYVMTADPSAELKVYSLTSLPSLGFRMAYDIEGSARGRSLSLDGTLLYAGATHSLNVGYDEFYALDVSNSGSVVLRSALDDADGGAAGIALSGTAAYLASEDDLGELHIVNIANSGSLSFATGSPKNIWGTENAYAVATSGTAALVGAQRGTGISELVVYKLPASGGAPTSAGPWYHEMSGSVLKLAADPQSCYAFAAVRQRVKALQVLNMKNFSLSELETYDLTTIPDSGRSLWYDAPKDRIFFISDKTLYILRPGIGTGLC